MDSIKQKAKELIEKFKPYVDGIDKQEDQDQIEEHLKNTKKCALINKKHYFWYYEHKRISKL